MPNLHQLTLALLTSITLAACGGGGSTSPSPSSNSTSSGITQADATDIMALAKVDSLREVSDFMFFTQHIDYLTNASSPNVVSNSQVYNWASGGNITVTISKLAQTAGLNAGDSATLSFNQVYDSTSQTYLNGSYTLTALTKTTKDIPAANWKDYSLPFSIAFSPQFTQSKGANIISRTGTLNFNTFSIDDNYLKTRGVTSNNYSIHVLAALGGSSTLTYSNLSAHMIDTAWSASSLTPVSLVSAYTLTASDSSDPAPQSINISNTITADPNNAQWASSATYTVTNFMGGKVTGTLISPNINITIDDGNNGTVDDSVSVPWATL